MLEFLTNRTARLRAGGERGFALIFVLFVTTVVMIGTATTLTVVSGGVTSSRQNQDNAAALAAAQAGVQRLVSALDATCPSASIAQCSLIAATTASAPMTGVIGSEKYTVSVVNPGNGGGSGYLSSSNNGTLIVKSTGISPVSPSGAVNGNPVTRIITAAISSKPNPLSLAYFSNYETVGSSFLNSYFGPRQILLTNVPASPLNNQPAVPALSMVSNTNALTATVAWNGASLTAPTGDGDNICDALYYDDPSNTNTNDPTGAGRWTMMAARNAVSSTALPSGANYEETGTLTPLGGTGVPETRYAPCETTFTTGENFNGSVYSRDAFYLSNSTANGAGPLFSVPAGEPQPALWTGWQATSSTIPAASGAATAYRSFPLVGGAPKTGSGTVSTSPYAGLSLPSTTGVTSSTAGVCVFTGPTRITLSGSTAQVTSPGTSSTVVASTCPAATSTGSNSYAVPVSTTTLYVQNSTTALTSAQLNAVLPAASRGPGDITYYSPSAGDAYVSNNTAGTGLTSGKLSIVTDDDIIVTGSVTAPQNANTTNAGNEPSWSTGSPAIDLVATNDVRVYHPVACANGVATYGANASLAPTSAAPNGWCPNDITGLYTTAQSNEVIDGSGNLRAVHPSLQYTNLLPNSAEPSEIDAAVFALRGSFYSDNFDRGIGVPAPLTVVGGVYENHHGLLGEEWATPFGSAGRAYAGFKLKINYLDYSHAGLGYVPDLTGGNDLDPWQVINVASGGPTP